MHQCLSAFWFSVYSLKTGLPPPQSLLSVMSSQKCLLAGALLRWESSPSVYTVPCSALLSSQLTGFDQHVFNLTCVDACFRYILITRSLLNIISEKIKDITAAFFRLAANKLKKQLKVMDKGGGSSVFLYS